MNRQTRIDEDGDAVFERPAVGDTCSFTCACGSSFSAKVRGFMWGGGNGYPDVALAECPCGSTCGFQVEPEARAA